MAENTRMLNENKGVLCYRLYWYSMAENTRLLNKNKGVLCYRLHVYWYSMAENTRLLCYCLNNYVQMATSQSLPLIYT